MNRSPDRRRSRMVQLAPDRVFAHELGGGAADGAEEQEVLPQGVEVAAARRSSGRPVVRLDRPVPRGATIEVEREALPPTEEDEYYAFQLVGLPVVEETGRELGGVKAVMPGIANDVLELDSGVLLPMIEDCVQRIDLERGRITVAPGFILSD